MSTPMTQERLDAIRGRLDARTPGEWEASGREIDALAPSWGEVVSTEVNCMNYCYGGTGRGVERAEDADLIAHAPEDLADLLAEVKRLRALTTVDDAMVERAARALYLRESDWSSEAKWDRLPEFARESWRKTARAALDAALGTGEDT